MTTPPALSLLAADVLDALRRAALDHCPARSRIIRKRYAAHLSRRQYAAGLAELHTLGVPDPAAPQIGQAVSA